MLQCLTLGTLLLNTLYIGDYTHFLAPVNIAVWMYIEKEGGKGGESKKEQKGWAVKWVVLSEPRFGPRNHIPGHIESQIFWNFLNPLLKIALYQQNIFAVQCAA